MPKLQPWDEYVAQVSEIHNNQYQYLNQTPKDGKIEVTCPLHGPFWVRKVVHKQGSGCPVCNPTPFKDGTKTTWEKAKEKHPEFDYSNSVYLGAHQPVTVICPKHGVFQTTPNLLRLGAGCKACGKEKQRAPRGSRAKAKT